MKIYINNHTFHYEIENLTRVFFPNDKLQVTKEIPNTLEKPYVNTALLQKQSTIFITVEVAIDNYLKTLSREMPLNTSQEILEREMAVLLFNILQDYTGVTPPWGILTGVRPIKLIRRLINDYGEEYAKNFFQKELLVSKEKTELSIITEKHEKSILNLSSKNSFSLYISIPFCPSRCTYCSFVSQSVEKAKKLIVPYVNLLCKELEYTAAIVNKLKLKLETVYIGGGTPTTLEPNQLEQLISTLNNNFDMANCREFTVEAGRPDTITAEKLFALKNNNVHRISINPQTLNDNVLNAIGRKHTAQEAIDAYNLANSIGFNNINMDLIAGLPQDTSETFKYTLDNILLLNPESITIHTLSMKKSSELTASGLELYKEDAKRTYEMHKYCNTLLPSNKYLPYYLYRQSRMVGNFENVGWSKAGYEGLYNVYVMDETHTILGCGAGAVTKLKQANGTYLERVFNYKYPYEYISDFDEMLARKERYESFYDEYFTKL